MQEVLNQEAKHILLSETRRIMTPASAGLPLHVVNNYVMLTGKSSLTMMSAELTITLTHVKNMIAYIHNEGILGGTGNPNITVSMREYKIKNELAITPVIYSMLYRQNSSPFKKMLKKEVEAELDDYIKNHSTTPKPSSNLLKSD